MYGCVSQSGQTPYARTTKKQGGREVCVSIEAAALKRAAMVGGMYAGCDDAKTVLRKYAA